MSVVARRFGANLKRERKRAGISQEELAFLSSLHRTEIGMLERGVRLPLIDTLVKLAGALECEPAALLEGLDWSPGHRPTGEFRVEREGQSCTQKEESRAARTRYR